MLKIAFFCILEEKSKTYFLHPVFCPGRRFPGTDRQIHFPARCWSDPTRWSNDRNIVSIHVLVVDIDMDALQGSFERPWTCSNTGTVISSAPGAPRPARAISASDRARAAISSALAAPRQARAAIWSPDVPEQSSRCNLSAPAAPKQARAEISSAAAFYAQVTFQELTK